MMLLRSQFVLEMKLSIVFKLFVIWKLKSKFEQIRIEEIHERGGNREESGPSVRNSHT